MMEEPVFMGGARSREETNMMRWILTLVFAWVFVGFAPEANAQVDSGTYGPPGRERGRLARAGDLGRDDGNQRHLGDGDAHPPNDLFYIYGGGFGGAWRRGTRGALAGKTEEAR